MRYVLTIDSDTALTRAEVSRAMLIAAYRVGKKLGLERQNQGEIPNVEHTDFIASWEFHE